MKIFPIHRPFRIALLAAALTPVLGLAGPVNINTADAPTLARELDGIGLARAQAIIEHREKNGPFKAAEDLAEVKGIGMKVVEQNRENIQLSGGGKGDAPAKSKKEKASD
jgi:competence protein ComEA